MSYLKCSYKDSCLNPAGPGGICSFHEERERRIEAETARIQDGLALYGNDGGVLRSTSELIGALQFESPADRARTMAAATVFDETLDAEEDAGDDTPVEAQAAEQAAVSTVTAAELASPVVPQPQVEPAPVAEPIPAETAPAVPAARPRRERQPRPRRVAPAPQPAPPPRPRCRVAGCPYPIGELQLCDACRSHFMCWRRYALASQPCPMIPSPQQEAAFKLLQTELEQKKPA